jgi:hypothetical protein
MGLLTNKAIFSISIKPRRTSNLKKVVFISRNRYKIIVNLIYSKGYNLD